MGDPGLVFGNTNGFAQPYIRGIGTDLIGPGQDSPVGFYLDGVYLPCTPSLLQQFGDISRIEVLKGPQGTLYGRNTTGGAVNIITRDPEQTFSADASVSAGNLGYAKAVTYVTGGLTDELSADFAGVYTIHNGFVNVLNNGDHLDNLDRFGLRGKIKYEINDNGTPYSGGDYAKERFLRLRLYGDHRKRRAPAAWSRSCLPCRAIPIRMWTPLLSNGHGFWCKSDRARPYELGGFHGHHGFS